MKIINLFLNSLIFMMSFTSVFSEPRADFSTFVTKYNKLYDSDEYEHRFNIFNHNLELINTHNTQNHSWKMELNNFADISTEEFNGLYKTYKTRKSDNIPRTNFTHSLQSLPDNFDWGRVIGRNHVLRITFLLFLVEIFQDTSITLIRVFSVWRVMQSSYLNKLASWFLLWRFKALLQLSCVCFTDQVLLILV